MPGSSSGMTQTDCPPAESGRGFLQALLPVLFAAVVAFLITGLSLPVIPLHVHNGLGLSEFVVGIVVGSQFAAALVTRPWAGHFSDRRGPKRAVLVGLAAAAVSGLLYLLSLPFIQTPLFSVAILFLGRALLGAAESLLITGAMSWGLGRVRAGNDARVIAWVGMAMFIALGIGAPIGTMVYDAGGLSAVGWATLLVPVISGLLIIGIPDVATHAEQNSGFLLMIGKVWLPGMGAAFSSVGYGAILAFGSLLFANRGWEPVWLPFAAYVAGLIAARACLGHLPDRFGGARTALLFVCVEALGLLTIWIAASPGTAALGAVLTGFGYALVYPGLGAEALKRAPPESRGLALGIYTAFLDLALGLGSAGLGMVAARSGVGSTFLAGAGVVAVAAILSLMMLLRPVNSSESVN